MERYGHLDVEPRAIPGRLVTYLHRLDPRHAVSLECRYALARGVAHHDQPLLSIPLRWCRAARSPAGKGRCAQSARPKTSVAIGRFQRRAISTFRTLPVLHSRRVALIAPKTLASPRG